MKNPFGNMFGSKEKKSEEEQKNKAERINDLRARRKTLVDNMSAGVDYRNPDDQRVLEDIDKRLAELEKNY